MYVLKIVLCVLVTLWASNSYAGNPDIHWAAKYLLPGNQVSTEVAEWTSCNGYIMGLNDTIIVKLRFDQEAIDTFRHKPNGIDYGFGLDIDIVECNDDPQLETDYITHNFPCSVQSTRDTAICDDYTNSEMCQSNGQKSTVIGSLLLRNAYALDANVDYYIFFKLKNCIPVNGTNLHLTLQLCHDVQIVVPPLVEAVIDYFGNAGPLERFDYYVVESDSYVSFNVTPGNYNGVCWGSKTQSGECTVNYQDVCTDVAKSDFQKGYFRSFLSFFIPNSYASDCNANSLAEGISLKKGDLDIPFGYGIDDGDTGSTSTGPDGNIKKVEISFAGKEEWCHSLSYYPGRLIDIKVKLTNKGDVRINNSKVRYYLSTNNTFNPAADTLLGEDENIDIEPGDSYTEHLRNVSIGDLGTYYIFCKITTEGDSNSTNDFSRNDDKEEYGKVILAQQRVSSPPGSRDRKWLIPVIQQLLSTTNH